MVINRIDKLIDMRLKVERSNFQKFKRWVEDNLDELEARLVARGYELR